VCVFLRYESKIRIWDLVFEIWHRQQNTVFISSVCEYFGWGQGMNNTNIFLFYFSVSLFENVFYRCESVVDFF